MLNDPAKHAEYTPASAQRHCVSDTQNLLDQLQAQQRELERQNEALQRTHEALALTSQRYTDLYDFAPMPYVTLERDGTVRHANHAAVALFGSHRDSFMYRRLGLYFASDSIPVFNALLERAFKTSGRQTDELELRVNGQLIWVVAEALLEATRTSCLLTLHDITERKQAELAERDQFLAESQRIAQIGSWAMAVADQSIQWSRETYRIFGLTPDTFDGTVEKFLERIHPQDRAAVQLWIVATMAGKKPAAVEFRIFWTDGSIRAIEGRGDLEYAPDGAPLRIVGTAQDITLRKQDEESLRLAASVYTNSTEAIMIARPNGTMVSINPAFTQVTGYTWQDAVGQGAKMVQADWRDEALIAKHLLTNGYWQGEVWGRRKNGEIYPKWLNIWAVRDEAGLMTHYVRSHSDISTRKKSETALLQLNQDLTESKELLRELAVQSDATREEERKHIAREVHDELGQVLTALRMDISLLGMRRNPLDGEMTQKLVNMKALVDRAIQGVRNVATNLRPTALDMGFLPAIAWLCTTFQERSNVPCYLKIVDHDVELDASRCIVVFRIVQESLTNVSRYAEASEVTIRIGVLGDKLSVEIQDDGCGFSPALVAGKKTFGMLGMRERAISLGGTVNVVSSPGQGTFVVLLIPLQDVRTEVHA